MSVLLLEDLEVFTSLLPPPSQIRLKTSVISDGCWNYFENIIYQI